MTIKFFYALFSLCLCRNLLAGEDAVPSRASTLLQANQPVGCSAATVVSAATARPARCSCGKEIAATPFSKESLYQFNGKFIDDAGRPFTLGDLRGRPVVLDMFFTSCGYACPLTVTDMLAMQQRLPAGLRERTAFLLVSFDTARDTPEALAKYRDRRGLDDRWVLLHGNADDVRELAVLLGVNYREAADHSFSHTNLLTILNPEGEIVHQRTGLQGGLDEAARALAKNSQ